MTDPDSDNSFKGILQRYWRKRFDTWHPFKKLQVLEVVPEDPATTNQRNSNQRLKRRQGLIFEDKDWNRLLAEPS